MSKVELVRDALKYIDEPKWSNDVAIAAEVGCSPSFVWKVRTGRYNTPRKDAKEMAIARNTALGKKRGRPRKAVEVKVLKQEPVSLIDACNRLLGLISDIPNVGISMDAKLQIVEVVWFDEVFRTAPQDLDTVIKAISTLERKRLHYVLAN